MNNPGLTIGRLARAAGVGIETVRYYRQRGLLPVPKLRGAYRYHDPASIDRIRFIKRAQELGFSLDEVGQLLQLEDGVDRRAIRRISSERLQQIEAKLADLKQMQRVLSHLVTECEHAGMDRQCPIIASLSGSGTVAPGAPAMASTQGPGTLGHR